MKILCNKRVIARNVKFCDSSFSRFKGLMFSRRLRKGEGLVLKAEKEGISETTIHMFYVFFPIEVIWVNNKMEVADIRKKAIPFTPLIKPRKAARYVVELKVGSAGNIKVGDKIEFLK